LNSLEQVVRRPRWDARKDWDKGKDVFFPEETQSKAVVRILVIKAEADARRSNIESCVHDLRMGQTISKLISQSPDILGLQVRLGEDNIVNAAADRCGAYFRNDPRALTRLRSCFIDETEPSMKRVLRSEMYATLAWLRNIYPEGGYAAVENDFNSGFEDTEETMRGHYVPPPRASPLVRTGLPQNPSAARAAVRVLRYWTSIFTQAPTEDNLALVRAAKANAPPDLGPYIWNQWGSGYPENQLDGILMPGFQAVPPGIDEALAHLRTTRALLEAMTAKAFTGHWPNEVKELDPFTGKPLRIEVAGWQFRIYSVGKDGIDDGGLAREETTSGHYDVVSAYPPLALKLP
jgi:hypothetical protein